MRSANFSLPRAKNNTYKWGPNLQFNFITSNIECLQLAVFYRGRIEISEESEKRNLGNYYPMYGYSNFQNLCFWTLWSQYAYSGVFGTSNCESEVKFQKFMNPRWRIQYGGRTFWLKLMFLNIFDSICNLGGFLRL